MTHKKMSAYTLTRESHTEPVVAEEYRLLKKKHEKLFVRLRNIKDDWAAVVVVNGGGDDKHHVL